MPVLKEAITSDPILQCVFQRATDLGYKTKDLAEASGVSAPSLVNWKNGVGSPQLNKLRLVADVVGVEFPPRVKKSSVGTKKHIDPRKPRR